MLATASSIVMAGGNPIPIDIGPDNLIDASLIEEAINERTVGIMPTQLNGRTCNMEQIMSIADKYNLRGPTMEQPQYNILFKERFEIEYKEIFKKYKIGSTIWSPLASGILTGKYQKEIPKKSRFNVKGYEWLKEEFEKNDTNRQNNILTKLKKLSNKLNITMAQLSIIWCLKNPNVSSVILGASSIKQLKENLDSINYIDLLDENKLQILT